MIKEARQWIIRDRNRNRMLSYTRTSTDAVDVVGWKSFVEPGGWAALIKRKYPPPYHDDRGAFSKWCDHEFVAQWLSLQQAALLKIARDEGFASQPEDALQTFLQARLLEIMSRWDPDHAQRKTFRNYLIFCFVRDCRRQAEIEAKRGRCQSLSTRSGGNECPDLELEDPGLGPEEQAKWKEHCRILNRCRRKLDPEDVRTVDLRYFDGLSYSEIAEVLGLDSTSREINTMLRVRCHRGLRKLKTLLGEEAPELAEEGLP